MTMLVPGQVYQTTYTVYDLDTAPSTVALTITKPDGTSEDPVPVIGPPAQSGRDYTYSYDYTLPSAGLYGFTWATAGPGTGRPTDWITCTEYRSIISLADAREYLDLRDTSRDEVLLAKLNAITRLIERRIGSCVVRQVTGEHIPGNCQRALRLPSGPVPAADSVTSVASLYPGGPSWGKTDLVVTPATGTVRRADGHRFWAGPWTWTGTAGRLAIPADVTEGAFMALFDLWAEQRGVSADSLEPSMEEVTEYETAVPPGWQLPPRVLQLLDGEKLLTGFA